MKRVLILGLSLFLFSMTMNAQCTSGDCMDGRGTYIFKSGAKYVGEFKNGEIHGVGTLHYSDGRRYSGQWQKRYQHGKGIMTYPNGKQYKGIWDKGVYFGEDGLAKVDLPNVGNEAVEVQNGCIDGDCENGEGIYVYADGTKYEGQFKNGKKNGYGACWFPTKDFYLGYWKDNYFHGKGTKYLISGDSLAGNWVHGDYVAVPTNDASKRGCVSGDCDFGSGTFITADGSRYFGTFKNGLFDGEGTCYYVNGDKYVGQWKRNLFHGEGTMYFGNGTTVTGDWEMGALEETMEQIGEELANHDVENADFDKEMKVYAVVVGVANYNHMRTLNYTDDDAYRLAMFLRSPEGGALPEEQISILIDEDATKSKILQTMHDVFARADQNDMIMFYFSGHGLKGSFIPSDFDGFNNQISHEDINQVMQKSKAKFKICIADACHSGSQEEFAARSVTSSNVIASYYKAFDKIENSTVLLLSSKAEEKSLESSGLRQGIFSHFLIRGLRGEADYDEDNIVQIDELHHFIYVNVRAYTGNKQSPIIKGSYDEDMPMSISKR